MVLGGDSGGVSSFRKVNQVKQQKLNVLLICFQALGIWHYLFLPGKLLLQFTIRNFFMTTATLWLTLEDIWDYYWECPASHFTRVFQTFCIKWSKKDKRNSSTPKPSLCNKIIEIKLQLTACLANYCSHNL